MAREFKNGHYCTGGSCSHSYHDGGDVKPNPLDPIPSRAKDAMAGADKGGPSMSEAWQNVKNEVGSLFKSSKENATPGYAKGGRIDNEKGVHKPIGKGESLAGMMNAHGYKVAANNLHVTVLDESRKMPNPKLKGLAHGGRVEYVPGEPEYGYRDSKKRNEQVKKRFRYARGGDVDDQEDSEMDSQTEHMSDDMMHRSQQMEDRRKSYEAAGMKDPNERPLSRNFASAMAAAGMAEGGEVEDMDHDMDADMNELAEISCGELCDAIHRKDSKGILEAIKAIILSCKE